MVKGLNIFFQVQETPSIEPKKTTQTYESVKECVETNYYGAKRTAEALIPLLQLSDSPRIVNVSSFAAKFVVVC